jgi:hypothetical protein
MTSRVSAVTPGNPREGKLWTLKSISLAFSAAFNSSMPGGGLLRSLTQMITPDWSGLSGLVKAKTGSIPALLKTVAISCARGLVSGSPFVVDMTIEDRIVLIGAAAANSVRF